MLWELFFVVNTDFTRLLIAATGRGSLTIKNNSSAELPVFVEILYLLIHTESSPYQAVPQFVDEHHSNFRLCGGRLENIRNVDLVTMALW